MSNVTQPCILSNPDISGIGVRTAIYAQNILSFGPAFFVLRDRRVTHTELETLETQSTTILITAFAILISTIIQARTDGITNFHATIILNLSWMNNTNLFIYLLLYVYRQAEEVAKRSSTVARSGRIPTWIRVGGIRGAMKKLGNSVIILGSLHLSLMAAVGIWLWSHPASFGDSSPCSLSSSVVVLGNNIILRSPGLRDWSILVYGLLLIPILNLIIPIAFLSIPYLILQHFLSSPSTNTSSLRDRINFWSTVFGLIVLGVVNIVFLVDTEVTFGKNGALLGKGDAQWTFGQTLALLLLMVPIRDLGETFWERRPKQLGRNLLDAASKGDLGVIEHVIGLGADINFRDSHGDTALYMALNGGHMDIVKDLVRLGANVDADSHGKTALHEAASRRKVDTQNSKFLTRPGTNIDARGSDDKETAEHLIKLSTIVDVRDSGGYTALHLAAMKGNTDAVECLVKLGANVHTTDSHSITALHWAAMEGNTDAAECLIKLGANVNAANSSGYTALHLAAIKGNTDAAEYLIKFGANVHATDSSGYTALHLAAWWGHTGTAECLIKLGANVNAMDLHSNTALHWAVMDGNMDAAVCLIKLGADVHATDSGGFTALHLAAMEGNTGAVKCLIQLGANVHITDLSSYSALHLAAQWGHIDTIECLVELGANINATNSSGYTALHLAVMENNTYAAECLINLGANVNVADLHGNTALHLAI